MATPEETAAFSVRVATPDDAAVVSALLDASYSTLLQSHYEPALLTVALPLMTRANPALLASGTYYIAETGDGRAVGCGGWTMERPGTGDVADGLAHIRHFATDPKWVGKGVGRELLSRSIRDAEARAVKALECYSTLNAEKFYGSAGFTRIRAIEVPFTPETRFPAIHMTRTSA
jgi:N-acetylglutamate synthase-like GNAT family acetyltransferase